MLPCNVSVRNSICNCYKPTVKYVCESIGDSNVNSSKLIYASSIRPSKPMVVMFTWVDLLFLVLPVQVTCGSYVRHSKTFRAINVQVSKPVYGSDVCSRKPSVT